MDQFTMRDTTNQRWGGRRRNNVTGGNGVHASKLRCDGRKGMTVRAEGQVHRESVRPPTERGESLLTECRWETGCCVLTACALLHRNTRRIKGLYVPRSLRVGSRRDAGRAGPGCAALDKPGPFIPQLCYDLTWLSRSTWSDMWIMQHCVQSTT
jgi:hypothetical protein